MRSCHCIYLDLHVSQCILEATAAFTNTIPSYETKNLSLEQVDELYETCSLAWKSKDFRPKISFQDVDDAGAGMKFNEAADLARVKRDGMGVEDVRMEKV